MGLAQSTLPPTRSTDVNAVTPTTQPTATSSPVRTGTPGKVDYADGKLEVRADNSSLNQILREIGRVTGMTITGGVNEQRVFGVYGPAAPAEVLADLLQGTGSNMLLRETSSAAPAELILSPRVGNVTPPNPNASGLDDDARDGDAAPQPSANPPGQVVQAGDASPNSRPPYIPPSAPAADDSQVRPALSPNQAAHAGPLSPAEVYQQLQQLQQAQPR